MKLNQKKISEMFFVSGMADTAFIVSVIIILVVSFAVYSNSLQNAFVYDDELQIVENHWIRDIKFIPEIFASGVWSFQPSHVSNLYRPLMHMIYMLNYHVFGLNPWGFRLTNILFHSLVSVLVFIITRRLLIQAQPSGYTYIFPAFMASLLFATHPVNTESVAWLGGLPDPLFTFFFLLALYLYMRTEEGSKVSYWLSVISYAVSTLCKEPALVLPLILIAYDYGCTGGIDCEFTRFKRYVPYIVVTVVYLIVRLSALGGFAPGGSNMNLDLYGYIINIFPLFTLYLEKLLFPLDLNAFYVIHPISSMSEVKGILSLIVAIGFIITGYISFKKNKVLFLGHLFIVLPLLPALLIPAVGEHVFAERRLYLPTFGFVMLIAVVSSQIGTKSLGLHSVLTVGIVSLTIAYSAGTISRNVVWRDAVTLYTDSLRKSPDAALPHYNLGIAYDKMGRTDEAINEFKAAIRNKKDYFEAHNNLGLIYARQQLFDEALKEYAAALNINPSLAEPHNNRGLIYAEMNRIDEAIQEYSIALRLKPLYSAAHNNLGNAYFAQRRYPEAIKEFQSALAAKTDFTEAHYNLGNAYAAAGFLDEAVSEYNAAIALNPNEPDVRNNLGRIYLKQNRIDDAAKEFAVARRLNPRGD